MSIEYRHGELLTGDVRRRRRTSEQKLKIIKQSFELGEMVSSTGPHDGVTLNLSPCFTPAANPQSNGMSESFVKMT